MNNIPGIKHYKFSFSSFLLANILLSILITLIFISGSLENWKSFFISFIWSFTISVTIWSGSILISQQLDRMVSWAKYPVSRSILGIIVLGIYSVTAFILVKYLLYFTFHGKFPSDAWHFIAGSSIMTIAISLYISLTFTAIGFFRAWKKETVNSEKLKAEMMAYKYESLRNQINPHFLFNSLNVLSELVYDNQELAVKFIRQLSDLFRYVLDSRDRELVPLSEELGFMESYIFLLKIRFEGKLNIKTDVEAQANDYLIPMTLQLLIENAVKHNEVSAAFPLWISIRKKNGAIEVENNLQPKNVGENSKKTGLKNLMQQYAFFSDHTVEVLSSGATFLVRVPILKSAER